MSGDGLTEERKKKDSRSRTDLKLALYSYRPLSYMYNAAVRFLASKRAHRGAFAAYTPGHTSVSAPAEAAASGLCREVPIHFL